MDLTKIPYLASPNQGERTAKPDYLIVHAMAGTYIGTKAWFLNPKSVVSAHFLVSKKGEVTCMVKPEKKAWHVVNFNNFSIGVEFEDVTPQTKKNCLTDPDWFTDEQLKVGGQLYAALAHQYNIPQEHIIGHNDAKLKALGNSHSDPGPYFPWTAFRAEIAKNLQLLKGTKDNGCT